MKNHIIFILLLLWLNPMFSQGFTFKPIVGINISLENIKYPQEGKVKKKLIKPGFDIGLNAEIQIKKTTSLEMGWIYSVNNASLERVFYPDVIIIGDYPATKEDYTVSFIKVPVNLLVKQKKDEPLFFGAGPVFKFSLNSKRDGKIIDRGETYSTKFRLDTKNGKKVGAGVFLTSGKEFNLGKRKAVVRINYDVDLTQWRYPTNMEYEEERYFSFRNHSIAVLFSVLL